MVLALVPGGQDEDEVRTQCTVMTGTSTPGLPGIPSPHPRVTVDIECRRRVAPPRGHSSDLPWAGQSRYFANCEVYYTRTVL
jgi:hypothetical protein